MSKQTQRSSHEKFKNPITKSIDTTEQKKLGEMTTLNRNEELNIKRVITRNEIEVSQEDDWYHSSALYKVKKQGETNVFEGVRQRYLYEVFTVYHKKKDIVYEVWKSIEGGQHKWMLGKMNPQELGDDYVK